MTVISSQTGAVDTGWKTLVSKDDALLDGGLLWAYGASVAIPLTHANYGYYVSSILLSTGYDGAGGGNILPKGMLLIFKADPTIVLNTESLPQSIWQLVVYRYDNVATQWIYDANGAVLLINPDILLPVPDAGYIYYAVYASDKIGFNSDAADDEWMRIKIIYQPISGPIKL